MIYADYEYYVETYMGAMPEESYQAAASRAGGFLEYVTLGRVKKKPDEDAVKRCSCALADQYHLYLMQRAEIVARLEAVEAADTPEEEVKSETVGSYSRTIATVADRLAELKAAQKELNQQLFSTAAEYLTPLGLMYRGGGRK